MLSLISKFRGLYGAHPLHLLSLLACFALTAYTISVLGLDKLWDSNVWWQSIVVWFVGAAILHDLVLFPLYALADRSASAVARARPTARHLAVPVLNFIRIPFLASGLLFLIYFPGIIEQGAGSYLRATGQTQEPFGMRWLMLCAGFFAVSAVAYAVCLVRARRRT